MTDMRSRTVVIGNRNIARHVLFHLIKKGWNVVGAVSVTGDPARTQAGFVSFKEITESNDIRLVETANINEDKSHRELERLEPDLCICPAWHQIIQPSILDIPTHGFVGFHSSDLPSGRGGAPINWSIIHGKSEITICLFRYSTEVDAGGIIASRSVPVQERDDVSTIIDRLAIAACDTLSTVSQKLQRGDIDTIPQSHENATYRPRRQPQDGLIDWNSSRSEIQNWIRAQTDPYPGAYTFFGGEKLTVWSATIPEKTAHPEDYKPGTVVNVKPGKGLDIAVSDGAVRLQRVQPESSPRMWADEFASRYDVTDRVRFGRHHAPSSWLYTGIRNETGGTDFSGATNRPAGEDTQIQAVILAQRKQKIQVHAYLNEQEQLAETIDVEDEERIAVEYSPEKTGTHTLKVDFHQDSEHIDSRCLKIFAY